MRSLCVLSGQWLMLDAIGFFGMWLIVSGLW